MNIGRSSTSKLIVLSLSFLGVLMPAHAQESSPAQQREDDAIPMPGGPLEQRPAPATTASASQGGGEARNSTADAASPPELLPTIPLPAQAPPPPAAEDTPASDGIAEIIVTATKRAMSVRDIPVSINATTGEALEKMGARDVQDYIATIPGISLQDGTNGDAGGRKLSVRGVGPSEVNGISGNQTVGQFIGDIPMTDPYSNFVTPDLDPFDLQTVEVLKGPQGTYFGASALNGAIRYVPNKPVLGQWTVRGFAEALSIDDGAADGTYAAAANLPVGETLALRATGVLQNTPGYIDNLQLDKKDANSRRKWSTRGGIRWKPSEALDINLMYLKQESNTNDILDVDNANEELTNNQHPGPSNLESEFDLASIDARYEFEEWGTLVWQSSLQHKNSLGDLDATLFTGAQGVPNFRGYSKADIKGTTHELRLVSPDGGDWRWIAGVFLLDYEADLNVDVYLIGTALPLPQLPVLGQLYGPHGFSLQRGSTSPAARETSLYGELTRRLGDHWELTVGARAYRTRISGTSTYGGLLGTIVPDFDIDLRDHGISPKVSLSYRPSANFMAYATVARGFQFGGINASTSGLPFDNPLTGPPVPPTFKSSVLWSREIGIRTDWFDRALRADIVGYDLDWSNAQFVERNDNLLIDTQYVSNVGKVRSRGAEASIIYLPPIRGLSLNLAVGYSHAITAVSYLAADGSEVPSGTDMPNTPRWQLASGLSYDHPWGPWLWGGSVGYTYSSRAYDTITHNHEIFDYGAYNLGLSLSRPDLAGAPSLSFGITNLLDTRGVVGRSSSTGLSGITGTETPSYVYIRPRALSLRLSFEFQ